MLTIFCGSDKSKSEKEYLAATKKSNKLDLESQTPDSLKELAKSRGLFGEVHSYSMRGLPEEGLPELAVSNNNFFFLADKLLVSEEKKLKKLGENVEVLRFDLSAIAKAQNERESKLEGSKSFRLTDCLTSRDKRAMWVEYWRAIYDGASTEDIFWKLAWQTKAMLIANKTKSASETDLHPYVYSKSKSGAANYKPEELINLSMSLQNIWQETYASGDKGRGALELFILSV